MSQKKLNIYYEFALSVLAILTATISLFDLAGKDQASSLLHADIANQTYYLKEE